MLKHWDGLYRKKQKEILNPNKYLHPSELPEKVMFEDHNYYYEFRVKVLQTFSGVICGEYVSFFS